MSLDFTVPGAFREAPPTPPPVRVETEAPAPAAKRGQAVSATLSGTLNANVRGPLQKVLEVCRQAPVRIDLARIAGADDAGCGLLLAALRACDKANARCVLAGAGHVAALLAPLARSGARANEHAWLLLLELRQRLGCQETFEDLAVAYAVTFEVSPPSWDPALAGHCEN